MGLGSHPCGYICALRRCLGEQQALAAGNRPVNAMWTAFQSGTLLQSLFDDVSAIGSGYTLKS
ncbi:MAG TPA: hypothetical protein DGT23_08805 [Micromonosporaceae bacterium]|nr:hypothetical protein [Micromonosporaceae bacterium]